MIILEITNLKKSFPIGFLRIQKKTILHSVSLSLYAGEIFGLLGPNGAGKTTLIQSIMGIIPYEGGEISIFGNKKLTTKNLQRIGYAPDNTQYYPHLTGKENILLAGKLGGEKSSKKILTLGDSLLNKVGLLFARDMFVKNYSAGMKKRLGIVISLINNPDLLIWDEPMSGLDPLGRIVIKGLMQELQKKEKTILFSTHILGDVEEMGTRCAILEGGHIIFEKKIADLGKKHLEDIFEEQILKKTRTIL